MPAPENNPRISPARLALAVKRLRAERENLALIASDPIAIVGMACRFPGGSNSPAEFWTALKEGRDCVGAISAERWKDAAVLPYPMLQGGYLSAIDGFDAGYFGISPREAHSMDPQQRLLLEVVWEALWDGGIEPASLTETDAGVFVAIYNNDYSRLHFRDTSQLSVYAGMGAAHSVATGRISFLLNLKGPSLALDSACSSSLAAAHLACQSLRMRECGLAIVAASSLKLLSDEVQVFSKWGMLSSDGKCKTFDASADGFVPGEGGGAVILKRLSNALEDGDRIRAVIRGTAVNHDGRTTVLTAPNGLAQEAVMRAALKNAMLEPHEISYIESHGTGTSLGDPIEVEAIGNVYGGVTAESAHCVLGAVKTNLGHLEAAAGIAGLIKTVLCLEQDEIPKILHFRELNPEISLAGTRLTLATENRQWSRSAVPRVAGISSFGLGGTNAHLIVEEAPLLPARSSGGGGRTIPLPAHRWQRQPFWIAESSSDGPKAPAYDSGTNAGHPLLGKKVDSPFVEGVLFASEFSTACVAYLAAHRLGDRAIVPFAAFLEIARAAMHAIGKADSHVLRNFRMQEPLFVSAETSRLQTLIADEAIEIASQNGSGWKSNAKGSIGPADIRRENIDLAHLRARLCQEVLPDDIYRRLEQTGLYYGPAFRVIQSAWSGGGESLVHLLLPKERETEAHSYGMHPTLLDGCLQSVMAARGESDNDLFLPISVDQFELRQNGAVEVWVHTKLANSSAETISADITIADISGNVVARLAGFTAKRTSAHLLARQLGCGESRLAYELVWRATPLPAVSSPVRDGERWLLVENRGGSCRAIAESLKRQGAICETVRAEEAPRSVAKIAWAGIVYDARGTQKPSEDAAWSYPEKCGVEFLLEFVKATEAAADSVPAIWIVASSAVAVLPTEEVAVERAPLWGLVRTLALEYPETAPVLIDFGAEDATAKGALAEAEAMLAEEIDNGKEPLVAFRRGNRYVARLVHQSSTEENAPRKLVLNTSGRLEDLQITRTARQSPKANQVEIRVRTAGLNFRDVLTALGMLPPRASIPGAECAGTIVRVGSEVRGFTVGDAVMAFAPSSLQTFVNVPADFIAAKPAAMSFAEAAGIPVAFLTARYGLTHLANLSAGQTILIHAAAGGLGLAAVQLAVRAGAKIFATAGSPEKREFLKQLGVEHVFDSRSLTFRSQVLDATGGRGVDVVLNSLAGDFIRASFDAVARNGCFLEVGKRGIWSVEEVAALDKNIRYFPYDLGDVAMENPNLISAMMRDLTQRFSNGELQPLPTALYPFEDATNAFRTMAQARHIGKIVLGMEASAPQAGVRDLVADGTVLVTGGLGALGIEVARWLAMQGAKRVVLAGRNTPTDHPIVNELRSQGIEIAIERADISDPDDTQRLLNKIRATQSPLVAVFHAAGVVQDSVLAKESWNSYREATAAKIEGAWNLDRLTQNDPMKLMVFFSSAASILGSPGQGSYAAGNAFLDALAHHRASRGFRSISVNWGAWASGGMAARLSPEQSARWTRQGSTPMTAASALMALERAIESGHTQVAVMDLNWEQFLRGPARRDGALFTELRGNEKQKIDAPENSGGSLDAPTNIIESMRTAAEADRESILAAHIKVCARRTLGLELSAPIDDNVPLQDVGLDSLMALEMRNELVQSLGLPLPAGLLFDYPAVAQLTQHLLGLLSVSECKGMGGKDADAEPVAALDALSDEEAERLLIEELDRAEREKAHA